MRYPGDKQMKCYQINLYLAKRFPLELYADKLVIETLTARYPNPVEHGLCYDYKTFTPGNSNLIMFNVTNEDLTYLTLLGIPSNCLQEIRNPYLIRAILEKKDRYINR